ncbi:tRNA modification GTPase MnmE [Salinivirga cyanobacteriivorans]|uniref:tRNA modification GTPase MnmE n=1 Tax=Salinivirga cyanobacteriivorans TaxID=1307839 RepID=A0A0S2HXN8_9BACT|nr:tRNA uridine-5-carboxymethylaminomethyl(34) synthesis GTPase MnmE [Salinivirga cyanobacteriivorans]ALO14741.1 tRNA modification GTPase MnmE [Salinivirga cyanobacteriivorans]
MRHLADFDDTICAISTAPGEGAIAIIRLSGQKAVSIAAEFIQSKKTLESLEVNHQQFARFVYQDETIDEVMVSRFQAPKSYTGEDMVEVACHGSVYIQHRILQVFVGAGARVARPGEFTQRAFMNGKMDLSQAEAVADLISSRNRMAHKVAMRQMKGEFSSKLEQLRTRLMDFTSLIELELDFSEEDVEFADRKQLFDLLAEIDKEVLSLSKSFELGNAIKNGIPVAIVGEPNVGKSTLLNRLLNEDRAIVSEIAGTTRDVIEDTMVIDGYEFRFIDTAGIRESTDEIETKGIALTLQKVSRARVVLYLFDARADETPVKEALQKIRNEAGEEVPVILVANKVDLLEHADKNYEQYFDGEDVISISALEERGIEVLIQKLVEHGTRGLENEDQLLVTNIRHVEALQHIHEGIERITEGLENQLPGDLLSFEIRQVLDHIADITGQTITPDDVLGHIFKNFCIGK